MFAADMKGHCGLNSWQGNSQISAAVSALGPEGPFSIKENSSLVLPPFSHNPTVHMAPDGTYIIFHIGSGSPSSRHPYMKSCINGTTPPHTVAQSEGASESVQ